MKAVYVNDDAATSPAQDAVNYVAGALKKEADNEADENYIPLIGSFLFHAIGVYIGVKRKAGLLELLALSAGFGVIGLGLGKGVSKLIFKK